jgi:hypothetical protein
MMYLERVPQVDPTSLSPAKRDEYSKNKLIALKHKSQARSARSIALTSALLNWIRQTIISETALSPEDASVWS